MRILGIDTTRKIARLFVYDDSKENKEIFVDVNENVKHSEGVFLYLEKLLHEAGLSVGDFDYFSAVVGPGSFTGIRVGMSIIKGFSKCNNTIIVPINTFEILADTIKNGIVLLNSTSLSCYYGIIKNKEIIEAGVVVKNQINDKFKDMTLYVLAEEQNIIDIEYNNTVVIDRIWENYIPTILNKIKSGSIDDFAPYYLQLSQAERNLKND